MFPGIEGEQDMSFPICAILVCEWASLVAQIVKNLPEMQDTWVWYLDQEDALEKEMASHSIILTWRIPVTWDNTKSETHLTCLLRNLYAGQEATVKTGPGTTDWFQIGKGVRQGCILSPCLFNLYAQYIMKNAGLDEAQAGIKIAERDINNLRYADDATLMAESKELKSLLIKVKEESEKLA